MPQYFLRLDVRIVESVPVEQAAPTGTVASHQRQYRRQRPGSPGRLLRNVIEATEPARETLAVLGRLTSC